MLVVVVGSNLTFSSGRYSAGRRGSTCIVDGASLGGIYALIALGYTMVYGILRMINFAHGEIFMVGAFAGYFTAVVLRMDRACCNGEPAARIVSIALMMAVVAMAAVAVARLVERVAYRPLRNAPALVPLISAIGPRSSSSIPCAACSDAGIYAYPTVRLPRAAVHLPISSRCGSSGWTCWSSARPS